VSDAAVIGSTASRPPFPVTLDNWQTAAQIGWTFCHIAEIFPTAPISRGSEPAAPLPRRITPVADLPCQNPDGDTSTVGAIMAATETDGWMVAHDGQILAEQYAGAMELATLHLLMSVSKSIVGVLVGALVAEGALNVKAPVTAYVPALGQTGYRGATVRHLLDMRSGIVFSEDYLNPDAEVRVLEQAVGWAPPRSPHVPTTLRGFLRTLRQGSPHGGPFDYRSCETDILAWVCEAATRLRFTELAGELVGHAWGWTSTQHRPRLRENGDVRRRHLRCPLRPRSLRGDDRARRDLVEQPPGGVRGLDRRQLCRRARLPAGLRVQPERHPHAGWHVSQPVLVPMA
jgi:CubicO group peptidase (beta-lactamase class C family)